MLYKKLFLREKFMILSANQINDFNDRGYIVFDTLIPDEILENTKSEFLKYWVDGVKPDNVVYADENRIQDAWKINDNVKAIATFPRVIEALKQIYQKQPLPFQTLNFYKGTEQAAHVDYIHFNSEPFGLMCGVWVALEDIGADQGPLVYYPHSNKLPEINFEEAGLAPDYQYYGPYLKYVMNEAAKMGLKEEYGLLKKGQALIWASNLIHGGSPQNNKALSRHSQVTHYFFEGTRAWRPGLSKDGRRYFDPEWIPLSTTEPEQPQAVKKSFFTNLKNWFGK